MSCNHNIEDKDDDADDDDDGGDFGDFGDFGDCGDVECEADVNFKGLVLAILTVVGITLLVVKLQPKV